MYLSVPWILWARHFLENWSFFSPFQPLRGFGFDPSIPRPLGGMSCHQESFFGEWETPTTLGVFPTRFGCFFTGFWRMGSFRGWFSGGSDLTRHFRSHLYIGHEWKGSHNPILRGLTLSMVMSDLHPLETQNRWFSLTPGRLSAAFWLVQT